MVANTAAWGANAGIEQDRVKSVTNTRWLREEFLQAPNAGTDSLYSAAADRGLRILPLLNTTDCCHPSNPRAFARTVAAHAARYGPGGSFWRERGRDGQLASPLIEFMNEPHVACLTGTVDPAGAVQALTR
jgi:hypothetical protein